MKNSKSEFFAAAVLSLFPSLAQATETAGYSSTPITDSARRYVDENYKSGSTAIDRDFYKDDKKKRLGAGFWVASGIAAASTIADIEKTFSTLGKCEKYFSGLDSVNDRKIESHTCYDGNGIMKPFVGSGKAVSYAVAGGTATGAAVASGLLKTHGKKSWWLPLAVVTGAHLYGAISSREFKIEITYRK